MAKRDCWAKLFFSRINIHIEFHFPSTLHPEAVSTHPASAANKTQAAHDALRQAILDGVWKAGERLPSEIELAARFHCSAGTINKAAALLAHEGLIERRRRTGMRVLNTKAKDPPRGGRLDAFAFIHPSELHDCIFRTVRGFHAEASEGGRRVVTLTTGSDFRKEAEFIGRLSEFDVKGVVIDPLLISAEDQVHLSQMILASKVPMVLANVSLPGLGCSSVQADNFHAGYTATRHLLDQGLRDIGYFSNHSWVQFVRDHHQGYRWALQEAGVAERPEWVFLEEGMHIDFVDPLAEPTALARTFLGQTRGMRGVVCSNDFMASGLVRAAQERGLRVPADLKVVGTDDNSALPVPGGVSLTTYRVPYEAIGRRAFRLLEAHVSGEAPRAVDVLIPGELVVRESSS